ncbi:MAG: peptide-methionine (R)-S-oxide reductase MsrB [Burkholderiales bacterium]
MQRREFMFGLGVLAPWPAFAQDKAAVIRLKKTPAEWKKLLPPERYRILFEDGTEPPGSSPLNGEKRAGTFICYACNLPLFDSATKFESGTGWPSFYDVIKGAVGTKKDFKLIFPRTEYHCAHCGGHHGHVFDDGPKPTGLRYCNNGLALTFVAKGEKLPALRT